MLATFIIYLLIIFIIGISAERYITKSEEGFYLGDRNFGPWATAISAGASDTSGWIFIGAAGYAYTAGIVTMWMLPGFVLGYLINWFVVAPKLREQGKEIGALSLTDFFSKKLDDKIPYIKIISSIVIIIFFLAYMASQLTAAGKALDSIIEFDYSIGIILSATFVIMYAMFGGYKSVMYTDLTQGIIMLAVLIIFPIYMIFFELGGPALFFKELYSIDPTLLSTAGGATGAAAFGVIIGLLGFGLGGPGQPHIVQRFLSARDDKVIVQGSFIAMFWVVIVMTGSNLLGLIGRIVYPVIDDPEYIFPVITIELLPPIIAGIILAAIFAAIQSTFSSQLMVATQSLANDLIKIIVKKELSNSELIKISRWTMVFLGAIATGIALLDLKAVFDLVLYAWAGLASSFGPLLIMLLYKFNVSRTGAMSGILMGAFVTVVWINLDFSDYIYELIPATILSTISIILVSRFSKKRECKNEKNI